MCSAWSLLLAARTPSDRSDLPKELVEHDCEGYAEMRLKTGDSKGLVENFAPANASVRFPQIWDASWFNWVQHNSSIADPILRNIGESLAVRASAKPYGPDANDFGNSVPIEGLKESKWLLSGPEPYLRRWIELLANLAAVLNRCAACQSCDRRV